MTWEVAQMVALSEDWDRFSVATLYTASQTRKLTWLGVEVAKLPTDLLIFQEILMDTRPDLVIETGTFRGGSAHFLQSVLAMMGRGQVVTIDLGRDESVAQTPGVTYYVGRSSTDPTLVNEIKRLALGQRTMVILDSDHSYEHVLAELNAYAPLISTGCYLVLEDTHFAEVERARAEWLPDHPEFEVDEDRERYGLTLNRGGYLRRKASE